MLVGFAGASCTGKTTLVNAVYEKLKKQRYNVAMLKEVARWVFEQYFSSYKSLDELREDKDAYYRFQKYVYGGQIQLENELLYQYDIVLTDRTVFDNLLYTITYCDVRDIFKLFKTLPAFGRERYDIIFLCMPVNAESCRDTFRSQNDVGLREYHTYLLYNWFKGWKNVAMLSGKITLEERVYNVIKTIQRWKRGNLL